MQRNRLRTEQVITRRKIARDSDLLLAAVVVEHIIAPLLGGGVVASLEDLNPRPSSPVVGQRIADFREVDKD